ncbi:MAG: two-component regulator propeller domain-containing protein, partial [bacterium]
MLAFFGQLLQAQESNFQFEQLTIEHGLPSNSVNAIQQDSQGFLWFGTLDGLARYDGTGFKVFTHDPSDSTTISHNRILTIMEDASHTLWIGTRDGLNRFDRHTEKFIRYLPDREDATKMNYPVVYTIFEDHSGKLWIGNFSRDGGLFRFDRQTETFTGYFHDPNDPNSLSHNSIRWILQDDAGRLWICIQSFGLTRFDPQTEMFTRYAHDPEDPHSIGDDRVWHGIKDKAGNLWFATFGGGMCRYDPEIDGFIRYQHDPRNHNSLYSNYIHTLFLDSQGMIWISNAVLSRFDPVTETFTHFRFSNKQRNWRSFYVPFAIVEDNAHNLWVGTRGSGAFKIDLKPKRFSHYKHDPENSNSLSANNVSLIYEDQNGILWVATRENGLDRFDPKTETFAHFKHDPNVSSSLSNNMVTAIHMDRSGTLWVGTQVGLNRLNPHMNGFTRYRQDPDKPQTLSHDGVETIYEDRSGTLWVGTAAGGVNKLNRENEMFFHFKPKPDASLAENPLYNRIYRIHEDRFGNFWVDGFLRLYLFDRQSGVFTAFKESADEWPIFGGTFFEDRSGNIWGGERGLNKADITTRRFRRHKLIGSDNHIIDDHVDSIYEDSHGLLWCGSAMLHLFDPEKGEFVASLSEKDGLLSSRVLKILPDDQSRLWLLTPKGISIFDENKSIGEQFTNLGVEEGIVNFTYTGRAFIKTKNGEIYWGGSNGLYRFYPDVTNTNPNLPPVRLTEFRIFNQVAELDTAISEIRTVHLEHDQNFFSLSFAALDFTNSKQNRYAYKLEGFDSNWIDTGNSHAANYTNVPPGEYTFRVKGSNNDGVWNEQGARLQIIIRPPWWRTWWAYTLYILVGVIAFVVVRRFELNRQRLKEEVQLEHQHAENLAEVDRMKSRFFANISHEFRTPLTLIRGPVKQLLQGTFKGNLKEQYRMILRNSHRLLRLINQLLDLSKLEADGMPLKARPENIVALTKGLTMSFESLAKRKGIDLSFVVDNKIAASKSKRAEAEITTYVDRDMYEKIITNLLSNAFKFTRKGGKVSVTVGL